MFRFKILTIWASLILIIPLFAQEDGVISVTANVTPDSGKADFIKVSDLKIKLKFSGYGVYMPSDYPVLRDIPLEKDLYNAYNGLVEIVILCQ